MAANGRESGFGNRRSGLANGRETSPPHRGEMNRPHESRGAGGNGRELTVRPNGAAECGHGWSTGRYAPDGAEPVETFVFHPTRPEGAEEALGLGVLLSAPISPSPRWGEKMLRDIRSPPRHFELPFLLPFLLDSSDRAA